VLLVLTFVFLESIIILCLKHNKYNESRCKNGIDIKSGESK